MRTNHLRITADKTQTVQALRNLNEATINAMGKCKREAVYNNDAYACGKRINKGVVE
ncbi:hypothetical protein HRF59_11565 [Bacillus velezensis]|uniref:hypothetical protein n=1 Tax=Bacillus amyloliquefaciens group TaxID=1938374 RepID=UPI001404AFA7|nr:MULTISPECIES: hypothetical protein [Bacillus amyloliquefaciens group]NHN22746.1 hypothetical protein [Bacillus amyloliquefaciens]NMP61891.1 hypothetical protein [Bacillus velezensis]NRG14326.1 hypothetical protein [Bacillus velezensis]